MLGAHDGGETAGIDMERGSYVTQTSNALSVLQQPFVWDYTRGEPVPER